MAYQYETQHNAASFTKGRQGAKIDKIVIHWWGDPAQNPSYEGVVSWFKNPNAGTSAHFVATGTGRRVAQLVDLTDTAYHAGNWDANITSIGIECDPRCRPEDYDVIAELIADIRSAYGDLPLYWHSDFTATRCPGNYDVEHLDRLSYTKYSHATEWGQGGSKVAPVPTPAPEPVPTPVTPIATKLDNPVVFVATQDTPVIDPTTGKTTSTIKKDLSFRAYATFAYAGKSYYLTEYSYSKGLLTGVVTTDLAQPVVVIPTPLPDPTPVPTPVPPVVEPSTDNQFLAFLVLLGKLITEFLAKFKK